MRKLLATTLVALRLTVTLMIIVALGVSGAGAAERMYRADQQDTKETLATNSQAEILPVGDGEEPIRGMAHSSKPCTEQAGCFQSIVVLPWGGDHHRAPSRQVCAQHVVPDASAPSDTEFSPRTSGEVHSDLGRQFTLVGARPSGTS
jgi:hypothetical protein